MIKMALFSLGLFVFSVPTLAPQTIARQTDYVWAENKAVGVAPTYQFLGRGGETVSLDGVLYPSFTGGKLNLDIVRDMAKSGKAYLFMNGHGQIIGNFFIESVSENQSNFMRDGAAQKIEFTLNLRRYDDKNPDLFGDIGRYIPALVETVTSKL